jgi:hypothetical protein
MQEIEDKIEGIELIRDSITASNDYDLIECEIPYDYMLEFLTIFSSKVKELNKREFLNNSDLIYETLFEYEDYFEIEGVSSPVILSKLAKIILINFREVIVDDFLAFLERISQRDIEIESDDDKPDNEKE